MNSPHKLRAEHIGKISRHSGKAAAIHRQDDAEEQHEHGQQAFMSRPRGCGIKGNAQTKESEINDCLTYIQKNKEYLKKLGFGDYDAVMNLLTDLQKHKDELFDLLGKKESQNYLVILENTNEKRPNG